LLLYRLLSIKYDSKTYSKLGSSNVKQLNTRLWSSLQNHTVDNCQNVKLAKRIGEKVFFKEPNSLWRLDNKNLFEEIYAPLIDAYYDFKNDDQKKNKDYTFATCHQSLSYEDFIEGIKPVLNNESNENIEEKEKLVTYEVRKGIFYNACEKAAQKAGFINLKDCLDKTKEDRKKVFDKAVSENRIHVLFLDEINRCNVSGVFGELITLIEEDKRLGNKNEISDLILPYSQDEFGVPPNLYIIGTMNTADRSVEALDTALRRRFSFEEMMPISELLSPSALYCQLLWDYVNVDWDDPEFKEKEDQFFNFAQVSDDLLAQRKEIWKVMKDDYIRDDFSYFDDFEYNGFNLQVILETINNRIEILLNRDHLIGHSYFLKVRTEEQLKATFKNNIIPLLQEYFYGDYEKIGLILGSGFFETAGKYSKDIFASFDTQNHPENGTILRIKTIDEDFDIVDAITKLLNIKEEKKTDA
jgi:5-methylcytosine-specific restriction endonuclease McrBC GTP-binding regulatory subunit McrB